MKKIGLLSIIFFAFTFSAQAQGFTEKLYTTYESYKEPSIAKRRIKHAQVLKLIERIKSDPNVEVNKVGESVQGRELNLISLGKGKVDVFLWSQMHGDEPTATQAIFDILNFFASNDFKKEKKAILSKVRLHFLPMLNPDGAEIFQRRNALGIDINRDALRLQTPEGKVLKKVRDSLDADFGFNLHDQSRYYNAEGTGKPATISYLATAYNERKDINEVRSRAMQVIVYMNDVIQKYAPGQVGRYNDDFEPRAFGDNIAKWGTSLILIESGGYANDPEKQEIRKLNYVSILSAIYAIATKAYKKIPVDRYEDIKDRYEDIPKNDRKLFDLKIENVTYMVNGKPYKLDLGIKRQEVDLSGHSEFYYKSRIMDQGDLSTFYGYDTFDASGLTLVPSKITEQWVIPETANFNRLIGYEKWLRGGYGHLRMEKIPRGKTHLLSRVNLASVSYVLPKFRLDVGAEATFFLEKEGRAVYAIINGFIVDLRKPIENQDFEFGNGLIYR